VNEWIRLLDSRLECQGFASSKAFILELLGQCERIHMATKRGKSLYLLDYSFRTEVKLDTILDESGIDVSQLNCWEVSDAILKSFPTTEKDVYMLSDWAEKNLNTSNIRVDENVFGSRSRQIEIAREFLLQINPSAFIGCLSILEALASQKEPPIQDIIDSGAVSTLLKSIEVATSSNGMQPVRINVIQPIRILTTMLKAGDENQVATMIDQGLLQCLDNLLSDATGPIMDNIRHALQYIAHTSINTRDKLLNSDILETFLDHSSHDTEDCDLLKAILCNKDMPQIDLNNLIILQPSILASICYYVDLSLVDFVISVLDHRIKRQHLSGEQSMSSYSSFTKPLELLICCLPTGLPALKILSQLSELDYFRSMAKNSKGRSFESFVSISHTYLESDSNETARQACISMGYLLRHDGKERNTVYLTDNLRDELSFRYINSIARLSCDRGHLITIHQRLLLYLQKQVTSDTDTFEKCLELQKQLSEMTFVEFCSLLECDDSLAEIEAELKTFLAKRTHIAIEDQIRLCIECWAGELKCQTYDIMTDDQIKAAAAQVPISMHALCKCGFMDYDHFSSPWDYDRNRNKYGTILIEVMENYHYAKTWQEYHHCNIFVILYDCASQIPILDE